jgi:hypothetical protein
VKQRGSFFFGPISVFVCWVSAFFRTRISDLLDTLPMAAYHVRLDRQLRRIARKN